MRTMAASKFKAQCLSVLDEVQAKREPVLVTKNGKPVAQMIPLPLVEGEEDPIFGFWREGEIRIHGDIMSPIYTDAETDAFWEQSMEVFK